MTSRLQENSTKDGKNRLLRYNEKGYGRIYDKMQYILKEKGKPENRIQRNGRKAGENMNPSLDRSYNETEQDKEKGFHIGHSGSVIRNDTSQGNVHKENDQIDMKRLSKDCLEIIWISRRNTNGSRISVYLQILKGRNKTTRNTAQKDSLISSIDQ